MSEDPGLPENPHSIVLVDDEKDIVTVFSKLLQRGGYVVYAFSEPEKAADFISENAGTITRG